MKKKLLSVLLIVLALAFGMQAEVYAAENSEMYTGISSITSNMGIYDSVLDFSVDVETRGSEYADAVSIDAELRTVDGRFIKGWSEDLEESLSDIYTFQKRRAVSESGTYFLHFTVYCYKDGVLLDEVTKDSKTATYVR
ncbi:unknown [Firmicutes bacterium CAG:238]|nr:unknown [Firmicutes bacterium CAG:238]